MRPATNIRSRVIAAAPSSVVPSTGSSLPSPINAKTSDGRGQALQDEEGSATRPSPRDVTEYLADWRKGDEAALDKLMPLVYDELHQIARRYLRRERPDHTLQTTALVHEAYLRLVDHKKAEWQTRIHFFAAAAQLMRHILVENARSHCADKRGGDNCKVTLDEEMATTREKGADLLALDEALDTLATLDPQQSRIVELRVFGGLTVEETAEAMMISPRTVKRDWSMAKAWLRRQFRDS